MAKVVEITEKVVVQLIERNHSVVSDIVFQIGGADLTADIAIHRFVELSDALGFQTDTDRYRVAAEALQKRGVAAEDFDQVEIGDAAPRTVGFVALDRQNDRRAVVVAGEPRNDDPDDALMPVAAGNEERVCHKTLSRVPCATW